MGKPRKITIVNGISPFSIGIFTINMCLRKLPSGEGKILKLDVCLSTRQAARASSLRVDA